MADIRPIDANALAEEFRRESLDAGFYRAIYEGAARRAEAAPTLDYTPVRHSEWIMVSHDGLWGVCKACNRSDGIDSLATHCRYCGAKMDGGTKDDAP